MKTTAASARSVNCVRGCAVSEDLDNQNGGLKAAHGELRKRVPETEKIDQ